MAFRPEPSSQSHGVADYRIVDNAGGDRGRPRRPGPRSSMVDITTTGATLAANNLKIVADGVDSA